MQNATGPSPASPSRLDSEHPQLAGIIGEQGVKALHARSRHLARHAPDSAFATQKIFYDLTSSLVGQSLASQLLHSPIGTAEAN